MPTDMGREFAPVIIVSPPHISTEDLALYRAWALDGLKNAMRQWFDVGLGEAKPVPPGTEPEFERMWIRLNQKRADAIVEYPDRVEIIEFRHLATSNVIGRLLTYYRLWSDDPKVNKKAIMHVVTDRHDADLEKVARYYNIKYTVVAP